MKSLLTSLAATFFLSFSMSVFAPPADAQTGGGNLGICIPEFPVLVDFQTCPECDIVFDFFLGGGYNDCEGCYVIVRAGMLCDAPFPSIPPRIIRLSGPCEATTFFPITCPANPTLAAGVVEMECSRCF